MGKKKAQAEMQFEKKQFVLVKSSQDTNYVSLQFSSLEWLVLNFFFSVHKQFFRMWDVYEMEIRAGEIAVEVKNSCCKWWGPELERENTP